MAFDGEDIAKIHQAHAALAEKLGPRLMNRHEVQTVNDGMPPGSSSIVTPREMKIAVDAGHIAHIETPFGKLGADLEAFYGPPNKPNYKDAYNASAGSAEYRVADYNPLPGLDRS